LRLKQPINLEKNRVASFTRKRIKHQQQQPPTTSDSFRRNITQLYCNERNPFLYTYGRPLRSCGPNTRLFNEKIKILHPQEITTKKKRYQQQHVPPQQQYVPPDLLQSIVACHRQMVSLIQQQQQQPPLFHQQQQVPSKLKYDCCEPAIQWSRTPIMGRCPHGRSCSNRPSQRCNI